MSGGGPHNWMTLKLASGLREQLLHTHGEASCGELLQELFHELLHELLQRSPCVCSDYRLFGSQLQQP